MKQVDQNEKYHKRTHQQVAHITLESKRRLRIELTGAFDSPDRHFACFFCDSKFEVPDRLKKHLDKKHQAEQDFPHGILQDDGDV